MNPDPLDRMRFVLVEPQSPGNVGAAARALHNMGLSRLTVVGDADLGGLQARRMAMGAAPLLERAVRAGSLQAALAGAGLTVATTRRAGKNRGPMVDIREAVGRGMGAAAVGNEVAFVFGREDAGLTTAELDACHLLARIPTAPDYPSLNLSQAVLVTAYEIWRLAAGEDLPGTDARDLAEAGEVEAMLRDLAAILDEIGFLNPQNPEEVMHGIRRMLGRAALDPREVRILRGMVRQIRWAARRGKPG